MWIYLNFNTKHFPPLLKLCELNTTLNSAQFLVFPICTCVEITVYQHRKCLLFLNDFSRLKLSLHPVAPQLVTCRDGFTEGRVREGEHLPSPGQMGCKGCYFHDKAEKYERHNEIHVIVMICHTVSEYHV